MPFGILGCDFARRFDRSTYKECGNKPQTLHKHTAYAPLHGRDVQHTYFYQLAEKIIKNGLVVQCMRATPSLILISIRDRS